MEPRGESKGKSNAASRASPVAIGLAKRSTDVFPVIVRLCTWFYRVGEARESLGASVSRRFLNGVSRPSSIGLEI